MSEPPHLVIIAGPNGAGKSTTAPLLLKEFLQINTFVNADVIAQGLSGLEPEKAALQAGRIMLTRIQQLTEDRETFAFETTLASRSFALLLQRLKAQGYETTVIFLYLPSPEIAIERVASRVKAGGHYVPADVIRRRFEAGLNNFFQLYMPITDNWYIWNATDEKKHRLIAKYRKNAKIHIEQPELWQALMEQYGRQR